MEELKEINGIIIFSGTLEQLSERTQEKYENLRSFSTISPLEDFLRNELAMWGYAVVNCKPRNIAVCRYKIGPEKMCISKCDSCTIMEPGYIGEIVIRKLV